MDLHSLGRNEIMTEWGHDGTGSWQDEIERQFHIKIKILQYNVFFLYFNYLNLIIGQIKDILLRSDSSAENVEAVENVENVENEKILI